MRARHSHFAVLAAHAAAMRATPTTTEAMLWQALRGSRLGVAFRRQFPIGRFIVDFCAPSARLVVEVDGRYHARRAQADVRRDHALGMLGYRVLRLPAELVLHRFAEAVNAVRAALARP
jgi:very-short-patch-repair endonuclease